jgi:hypothetical protein
MSGNWLIDCFKLIKIEMHQKNRLGIRGNEMQLSKLSCLQIGVLFIGLSTMILSPSALAGDTSPATVTFSTGNVQIIDANKQAKPAVKNATVNVGDTIETNSGRIQLAFADGGKVSIQPNSIYKINKFAFSGAEDGSEYNFTELVKGGLRTITGLVGHKNRDRYQLKTAVATIGIRGTEFTLNFNNNQLLMTTNHGSVDVCNSAGCLNALTGQSISVTGIGVKPKPSDVAAVASVTAPAKAKAVQQTTTETTQQVATTTESNSADAKVVNTSNVNVDTATTSAADSATASVNSVSASGSSTANVSTANTSTANESSANVASSNVSQNNTMVASLDNSAASATKKTDISKTIYTETEDISDNGVPVVIEQQIEKSKQPSNNANANSNATPVVEKNVNNTVTPNTANTANTANTPSLRNLSSLVGQLGILMKSTCQCGTDEVTNALISTRNNSTPSQVDTAQQTITFTSFSSFDSDGIIGWGRGQGKFDNASNTQQNIEWMDYLIGEKPDPLQLANLSGTYSVFGSTAPISVNANRVSSTVEGPNKVTGTFNFNFTNSNYNYNLVVKTNFDNFNLTGNGNVTASNPTFASGTGQSSVTSAGLTCAGNACNPVLPGNKLIQGAFFGKNGERVGLQYGIGINNSGTAPNQQLYGSAVLK